jgi:hypothetical protein
MLKGDSNYTHLYFQSGTTLMFGYTLKWFLDAFPELGLIRISKTWAVRPDQIASWEYFSYTKLRVEFAGNFIWVPARRIAAVHKQLKALYLTA